MSPDDPRHGQRKGYYAHRADGEEACTPCKRAAAAAQARYEMRWNHGINGRVDPTGTRRRLQALCAIGWTFQTLDRELEVTNMCQKWAKEHRTYIYATTAARIAELYERLSMRLPPENTREERINVIRARNLARRNGWPPPLAWDRIDDPNEQPRGWQYVGIDRKSRAEIVLDLDARGAGITEVCKVLKVKRDAVEKWAERADMKPLYRRLVEREQPRYWRNATAEGGVA